MYESSFKQNNSLKNIDLSNHESNSKHEDKNDFVNVIKKFKDFNSTVTDKQNKLKITKSGFTKKSSNRITFKNRHDENNSLRLQTGSGSLIHFPTNIKEQSFKINDEFNNNHIKSRHIKNIRSDDRISSGPYETILMKKTRNNSNDRDYNEHERSKRIEELYKNITIGNPKNKKNITKSYSDNRDIPKSLYIELSPKHERNEGSIYNTMKHPMQISNFSPQPPKSNKNSTSIDSSMKNIDSSNMNKLFLRDYPADFVKWLSDNNMKIDENGNTKVNIEFIWLTYNYMVKESNMYQFLENNYNKEYTKVEFQDLQ